jgi:hypothetical protein
MPCETNTDIKYPVILSFDVGVIHLSYCLMTKKLFKQKDGSMKLDWHIIQWNNIDLSKRDEMKCDCGKKASLSNMVEGVMKYYCKVHAKKINTEIKTFEAYFKTIPNNTTKCNHMVKDKVCGKKALYNSINNNTICNTHAKALYKTMGNSCKMKSFKIKDSNKLNFDDVKYDLLIVLEKLKELLVADIVVIENQPSFKNPRMKSIATTIYDYYLIRGVIDKHITGSNITQVKFMAPSNKLKLADDKDSKELVKAKSDNDTKAYKLTKSLGIKYCSDMICHLSSWTEHFNSFKKKDDMADSFLQGAYYFGNNVKIKEEVKVDTIVKEENKVKKQVRKKKEEVIEIEI